VAMLERRSVDFQKIELVVFQKNKLTSDNSSERDMTYEGKYKDWKITVRAEKAVQTGDNGEQQYYPHIAVTDLKNEEIPLPLVTLYDSAEASIEAGKLMAQEYIDQFV
jgi:hypothetical protein